VLVVCLGTIIGAVRCRGKGRDVHHSCRRRRKKKEEKRVRISLENSPSPGQPQSGARKKNGGGNQIASSSGGKRRRGGGVPLERGVEVGPR